LLMAAWLVMAAAVGAEDVPAPPDVAAPPADAEVTASGLATKVLRPGDGDEPVGAQDIVLVHYTGWTTDGKMFDSSVARGEPAGLPVDRLIPGWSEGLQLMVEGEKRRMWIPEKLAYRGAKGRPKGMLVFDVELLEINRRTPWPVPPDVAAPPADAEVSKSGLASKVLRPGSGSEHPRPTSRVTVIYTGWTTGGKMIDSSIPSGHPATFSLGEVIKGWTEGLQLMVKGERRRFWIPAKLAYKGQKGKPKGMLVFDIELVGFQNESILGH